jgi:non-ribosomal peptide synthetase component F
MNNHSIFNHLFLLEQFENIVLQYANKTAIVYEQQSLSYSALNEKVNQTAHFILSHGVKPGTIIGLFTNRSFEMVVGYLAILKAGCIVAPLDSSDLSARQIFILQDTGLEHILTQRCFAMHFSQAEILSNFIYLDLPSIATLSKENIHLNSHLNNPAILIYTSGSSGQPKGVMISHSNLSYYMQALQQSFNVTKNDIYLYCGDISLIVSARQLLMPLTIGATVVIATKKQTKQPLDLLKAAKTNNVTIFDHVPSFWKSLEKLIANFSEAEKSLLFDLKVRMIAVHGEAFKSNIAQFLFNQFKSNTVFKNFYGQTEGTGIVASHTITRNDLNSSVFIPIG